MLGVTVVLTTFLFRGKRPPVTTPVRFEIQLPAGALTFMLSPDGRQLAFLAPGPDGYREFHSFGPVWADVARHLRPISKGLASKFPTQRNREFFGGEQAILAA